MKVQHFGSHVLHMLMNWVTYCYHDKAKQMLPGAEVLTVGCMKLLILLYCNEQLVPLKERMEHTETRLPSYKKNTKLQGTDNYRRLESWQQFSQRMTKGNTFPEQAD